MNIEFEGFDELFREIDKVEGMTEELKDEALIEGGELLLSNMKDEVYRVLTRRTGEGQASLTRTNPKNGELFVGTKGGARRPGFYLYMQEVGFYNVRARRYIPPKPFASIAFNKSITGIMNTYTEVFRRGLGMK